MIHASSSREDSRLRIRVDCYAGYRGEETPRRLTMGQNHITVVAVQDRWLAPDHRYFKILGDDGGLYIIRHAPLQDTWQLVCYQTDPGQAHRFSPAPQGDPQRLC